MLGPWPIMSWVAVLMAWPVASVVVGLTLGRAIKLRDERG
jgi:hypothetical protein